MPEREPIQSIIGTPPEDETREYQENYWQRLGVTVTLDDLKRTETEIEQTVMAESLGPDLTRLRRYVVIFKSWGKGCGRRPRESPKEILLIAGLNGHWRQVDPAQGRGGFDEIATEF